MELVARNNWEWELGLLEHPAWADHGQGPTLMVGEAYKKYLTAFLMLMSSEARRDPPEVH